MNHTLNQLYQGMTFLYGGLAAGIFYELLAVIRRHCTARAAEPILDAVFTLAATLCSGMCFLIATGGELRLYGFALLLTGGLAARWAFQPLLHVL